MIGWIADPADRNATKAQNARMIEIKVNGRHVEIEAPMTVEQLLDTVDVPPNYLAVEVNADVVPREAYTTTTVGPGDEVEVVTLVGGSSPVDEMML